MASSEILDRLGAAITQKPPFCTGTVPVPHGNADLFYKQGKSSSWLDLSQATEDDLKTLASACEPATFGRDQEDVLDESYRKAGKMDSESFSTKFNVDKLGIVDRIRGQLLDGADEEKVVSAELYKLNVYGKGSFFKAHKDTPRGDTMFGSLVVVFPTPHEGGALVLRHFGQEWTFDSATLTRQEAEPSVAYIAFYSDVDHEVSIVDSGYRVTLTYNLFFENKTWRENLPQSIVPVAPDDALFHNALSTALADPSFLPEGGYLGFGLSFKYPIDQASRRSSTIVLKGSDAVIYRVCRKLSLSASLHAVYEDRGINVLAPIRKPLNDYEYQDEIIEVLRRHCSGMVIHEFGKKPPVQPYRYDRRPFDAKWVIKMAWVTPLTKYSHFGSPYTAYGNEYSSACVYGDLCMAAKVGPFGERATVRV
ncbi:hypothetical protein FPV67DRAFT_1477514 [Lyophyllum atratum]|nr:hypothetical protein FPV67DRAFT_1477514 [Lyophyllum atratum]